MRLLMVGVNEVCAESGSLDHGSHALAKVLEGPFGEGVGVGPQALYC